VNIYQSDRIAIEHAGLPAKLAAISDFKIKSEFSVAVEKGDIAVVDNYTTWTVESIAKTSTNVLKLVSPRAFNGRRSLVRLLSH
jgi:hypothetical protein